VLIAASRGAGQGALPDFEEVEKVEVLLDDGREYTAEESVSMTINAVFAGGNRDVDSEGERSASRCAREGQRRCWNR
jgi:hypothetical protein